MKGRVALEMGTYEIFLTELVLDNVLTNWESDEIAAMLSSLVFQSRGDDEDVQEEIPRLNEVYINFQVTFLESLDICFTEYCEYLL